MTRATAASGAARMPLVLWTTSGLLFGARTARSARRTAAARRPGVASTAAG